jgi:hypothetical protein
LIYKGKKRRRRNCSQFVGNKREKGDCHTVFRMYFVKRGSPFRSALTVMCRAVFLGRKKKRKKNRKKLWNSICKMMKKRFVILPFTILGIDHGFGASLKQGLGDNRIWFLAGIMERSVTSDSFSIDIHTTLWDQHLDGLDITIYTMKRCSLKERKGERGGGEEEEKKFTCGERPCGLGELHKSHQG